MNPLPLESIQPERAYLDNTIIGKQRATSFTVAEQPWEFQFSLPISDYQSGPFFKVRLSDHTVWLSLNQMPPLSFFSSDLGDVDINALPSDIQPIILESSWEPILESIEAFLGVVTTIEEFSMAPPADLPENQLFFTVKPQNGNTPFSGCLHLSFPALELLAVLYERSPTIPAGYFNNLEVPARLVIGRDTLPLREFTTLQTRDILLVNAKDFLENGNCEVVFANQLRYKASFNDGTVTLLEPMEEETDLNKAVEPEEEAPAEESFEEPEATAAPEEPLPDAAPMAPQDLDSLPINLVFEVGQKRIPLKELQTLKPGFTFELTNPTHNPVTIRANGRVIGSGQLLQIGERVGVRVSTFTEENA